MKPAVTPRPRLGALALGGLCALLIAPAPPPARRAPRVLVPVESASDVARARVRCYIFDKSTPPTSLRGKLPGKSGQKDRVITPTPLNEADKKGVTLAEQPRPLRAVILAAGFPYRAQVEEFRRHLGLPSDAAVLGGRAADGAPLFRFLGVELQRRDLGGRGEPLTDYRAVDLDGDYRPWLVLSGKRFEAEPEELAPVIFPGLVMPRLALFMSRYPPVERRLEKLRHQRGPKEAVPEHCLLRVLDVSVRPGRAYQYRLRVRMANPDHPRAEVVSAWYELPRRVVVPADTTYYAVDQGVLDAPASRDRRPEPLPPGQVVLQAHRWVDQVPLTGRDPLLVGEWVVAGRLPVYRGEYVGRAERVEVPVWKFTREEFVLARADEGRRGLDVDFSNATEGSEGTVLVDLAGGPAGHEWRGEGRPRRVTDATAAVALLLSPDGRLIACEGGRDAADPDRYRRLDAYRALAEWIRRAQRRP